MTRGWFGALLGWLFLIIAVALFGIGGRYAPYALLLPTLPAIPYLIAAKAGRKLVPDLTTGGFLLAFGLLTLAHALSARQPSDVLVVFNFAWLLLFAPMQALMRRLARPAAGRIVARLALAGVALAFAIAVYEWLSLGVPRIGRLTGDPIRIANISVILGLVSLVGMMVDSGWRRFVYLLGPLLALGVAYLAGTRGAMLSLAIVGLAAIVPLSRRRLVALAVAVGGLVAVAALLLLAAQLKLPRVDSLVRIFDELVSGSMVTDLSAQIRLTMLHLTWPTFLDSPWYGHGWQRLMEAVAHHLPESQADLLAGQPHLHDDVADFAVGGGVLGLLAYLCMLGAPLAGALRAPRDGLYTARLFAVLMLVGSYAMLGLNALMFGYEQTTALYCALAAVVLGFLREEPSTVAEAASPAMPMRPPGRLERGIVWLLLALSLVLPTVIGLVTPYVVVVIGIVIFFALLFSGRLPESYAPLAPRLLLFAFAGLGIDFAISAQAPADVVSTFNFTMLLLAGPLMLLLARAERPTPGMVATLATLGVAITAVMVGVFWLQGHPRPGGINLGPIVLSNAVLGLAVVASAGAVAQRSRASLLLPLTLVVAVVVTLMTRSRGPLIAVLPLAGLTVLFLWRTRFRGSRRFWLVVAGIAGLVGIAGVVLGHGRIAELPRIVEELLGGGAVDDQTTRIRLALYHAGWRAVADAPWFGHGWVRLMTSITPYIDPDYTEWARKLPQLHNDVLNFAVAGGVVGIALYLVIITAPLIAAWRSRRDALWAARLYGTSGLAIVYACGGLTDLMFGHEYHTWLFVMLNGVVLCLLRERSEAG